MSNKALRTVDVDATTLKMSLGTIGERVQTEDLQITKHGTPQAVLISPERYQTLLRLEPVQPSVLDQLRTEFDSMLIAMQEQKQAEAMAQLMSAPEDDINAVLTAHYDANPVPSMAEITVARPRKVIKFGLLKIAKPVVKKGAFFAKGGVKTQKAAVVKSYSVKEKFAKAPVAKGVKKAGTYRGMKAKSGSKSAAE